MYSRPIERKNNLRIPHNYSGSIFGGRQYGNQLNVTYNADDSTSEQEIDKTYTEAQQEAAASVADALQKEAPTELEASTSSALLSPIGELGTEEILLIAIALIIFQSGTEPHLALMLLSLLFIN